MYRGAFDQAMIGMAVVTPDGRWLRANHALCTLLGYSEAELAAVGFRPLLERDFVTVDGDQLARLLDGTSAAYESEQWFQRADGSRLLIHLHVALVRDRDARPDYLIVQVRDVTAQHAIEQARADILAQLERSNRELEQFASVASHDLQEPLRKIRAFGDRLLTTENERLSERGRDYLARMHQAATRMQDLVGGLLTYSRTASRPLDAIPTDLGMVIAEVSHDLEAQLARTRGRITAGPLPTLPGDPLRLRQLFQNLIANALKFSQPQVPPLVTIAAEYLEPDAYGAAGRWRITVADNGIGFDEQYGERIFGMFQRLHGRTEYDGSGIGLALCRQIAERHGGSIDAHGRPGAGATFAVTLPAAATAEGVSNGRPATID